MLARLLLLFVVVPLVELTLLLVLADLTDWRITLLLVLVTGLIGTLLARSQGFRTYRRIHQELSAGHMPTESLLDAVMIFVAGALLLTPGMLTDLLGLSLLIPFCRAFYRRSATRWIKSRFHVQVSGPEPQEPGGSRSRVIDSYVVPKQGSRQDPPDHNGPRLEDGGSEADRSP